MADKKKHIQNKNSTPNISFHYYTDPIYGSGTIYGFEDYTEEDDDKTTKQSKDGEALDEPIESWGWVNNVD